MMQAPSLDYTPQNKEYLTKLLKNIKNDHIYIGDTSDYICMFRHSAKLIAELTTAHFVSESAETKVLYFFIMHEVMTRSKDAVSESHSLIYRGSNSLLPSEMSCMAGSRTSLSKN